MTITKSDNARDTSPSSSTPAPEGGLEPGLSSTAGSVTKQENGTIVNAEGRGNGDGGGGLWRRVYEVVTWTPPRCRWDPKRPPRFSLALNLLFGFAATFTVSFATFYSCLACVLLDRMFVGGLFEVRVVGYIPCYILCLYRWFCELRSFGTGLWMDDTHFSPLSLLSFLPLFLYKKRDKTPYLSMYQANMYCRSQTSTTPTPSSACWPTPSASATSAPPSSPPSCRPATPRACSSSARWATSCGGGPSCWPWRGSRRRCGWACA